MPCRDQFVRVNGLRLHYCEWGRDDYPAVVLLHGGCAHAHWWDLLASALADEYRLVALDLRGHGDSDHVVPPAYRVDDYVSDLAAFVEIQQLQRFALVGHSLGGTIAAAYAGQAAARLSHLVIVDSQLRITQAGARYMARLGNFPRLEYPDHATAVRRFRLLPTATKAPPEVLAQVAAYAFRQLADGRWVLKFDRRSLGQPEAQDFTTVLQRLDCPVLLLRGIDSTLCTAKRLAELAARNPRVRGVEIEAAHHHVMLDNPARFEAAVRSFLADSA